MEHFWKYGWPWALVIASLFFLLYTLVVVKEEKKAFQESSLPFRFGPFTFCLPSWWQPLLKNRRECSFSNPKSKHHWRATLFLRDDPHPLESDEEFIQIGLSFLKEREIEFDPKEWITQSTKDLSKHPALAQHCLRIFRLEGSATLKGTERRYIDLFGIKELNKEGHLLAISESGILSGVVEGPYFEEVMLSFSLEKRP